MMVANYLGSSGQSWQYYFSLYNSGTYSNQYMILNYGLFQPKNALKPGTLWLVEQIPEFVMGDDVTQHLARGYWPSYNYPFFHTIYNMTGYYDKDFEQNVSFNTQYQQYPRAKIFRRDHHDVSDIESMKKLMRTNKYQSDPFSQGLANNQICARKDLLSTPISFGCIDSKVTSFDLFNSMSAWVVGGPTYDDQPVFNWTNTTFTDLHDKQPEYFNFTYELFTETV